MSAAPDPLRPGDRVRLTKKAALAFNKHQTRVNWRTRRGTVNRVGPNSVAVEWDGRHSLDQVMRKGLVVMRGSI